MERAARRWRSFRGRVVGDGECFGGCSGPIVGFDSHPDSLLSPLIVRVPLLRHIPG